MAFGRKTGGRKKGSRNKRPRVLIERIEASGLVPLECMLSVMRDETAPRERRDEMAKAAAPFVHPRLAAMKVQGDRHAPLFDLSVLADNELAFLRRTVLKATQIDERGATDNAPHQC
jgi:hypothetical protein